VIPKRIRASARLATKTRMNCFMSLPPSISRYIRAYSVASFCEIFVIILRMTRKNVNGEYCK
jgi:hypothetical protein